MLYSENYVSRNNLDVKKYQREIELNYLTKQSRIVNIMLLILSIPLFIVIYYLQLSKSMMYGYISLVLFIILMQMAFVSEKSQLERMKLIIYMVIFCVYSGVALLVATIQTPSFFTTLFLIYAIVLIYQDLRAIVLNNVLLIFFGTTLVVQFPNILLMDTTLSQVTYIVIFLVVFLALLTLASLVIVKRRLFLYYQVAKTNEHELRMIDLYMKVKHEEELFPLNSESFFRELYAFFEEFSSQINIENVFNEKIDIIKDLSEHTPSDILEKYPNYSLEELEEMDFLSLKFKSKMVYILNQIGVTKHEKIHLDKKKALSKIESINQSSDTETTRIITFSLLYTLCLIDYFKLQTLSREQIMDIVKETDLGQYIDYKILSVYLKNDDVLEKIVNDGFSRRVKV